jgi:hypothetical protein
MIDAGDVATLTGAVFGAVAVIFIAWLRLARTREVRAGGAKEAPLEDRLEAVADGMRDAAATMREAKRVVGQVDARLIRLESVDSVVKAEGHRSTLVAIILAATSVPLGILAAFLYDHLFAH